MLDKSKPPLQKDAYDHQCFCIPFCMFHQFKGHFYTVDVPVGLEAGASFVVEMPPGCPSKFVRCTAPDFVDTRAPNQCLQCERGGGKGKLILEQVPKRQDNDGPFVVQALRTRKDPLWNSLKFCLPLPFLCAFYTAFYINSGGWCEDMVDLKWTEDVATHEVGSLPVVKAVYWDRNNTGDSTNDNGAMAAAM